MTTTSVHDLPPPDEMPAQNPTGGLNPQRQPSATLDPSNLARRGAIPLQAVIMPAALVAIVSYFAVISPGHAFLGPRNISNLAIGAAAPAGTPR